MLIDCRSAILTRPCKKEQQLSYSVLDTHACISVRVPKHAIKIKITNTYFFLLWGRENQTFNNVEKIIYATCLMVAVNLESKLVHQCHMLHFTGAPMLLPFLLVGPQEVVLVS